jgi:molybdopterin converting factor small subunit
MTLLPFGPLAEIITDKEIGTDGIITAGQLKKRLLEKYPDLAVIPFSLAVNNRLSQEDLPVGPEDSVALLPPFSGG